MHKVGRLAESPLPGMKVYRRGVGRGFNGSGPNGED